MNIYFYPGKPDAEPHTGLARFVHIKLCEKSKKQWKKMDFWLAETKRNKVEELRDEIFRESKKPQKKKKISALGNGLYEYRGTQSKQGTIRLYFCFDEEILYILDAEFKTGDSNKIEIARERKKEMGL